MNQALKPYMLLACVAFVLGFASYLAVGGMMANPGSMDTAWPATISAPAPPFEAPLAAGKHI